MDDKIWLNGEDRYLDEIASALAHIPMLSMRFQLHVIKDVTTGADNVAIYIE